MACAYDVLVVDLDGTLLARDGSVSEANRAAIAHAREAGLTVIIATGRALVESRAALEAIGHDGLVVAAGGSLLCEAATGRTLQRHAMPRDLVEQVTATLLGHGHKVLILKDSQATGYDYLAVGPGELDPASRWWFQTLPVRVRFVDSLEHDPHPDDTVRTAVVACGDELGPLAAQLRREIGDRGFLQHWAAVTETSATGGRTHLLEVFNPNVNKWTMVDGFCQRQGIDPARVAAIGDGLNDLDLLAQAGLGIAMANADEQVAAVADRRTSDHDEDGLADAIGQILAGAW